MSGGLSENAITLPWPPRELSPNARVHWAKKAPITKSYREACRIIFRARLYELNIMPVGRCGLKVVSFTFCPPDKRKRDDDGMIGAFKAGRDGVADALGVDDNTFRPSYHFSDPAKGGCVRVTVES